MTKDTRISSDQDVATASFPNIVAFLRTLKGYPDKVVETAALEAAQALSVLQARVGEVEKERDTWARQGEWAAWLVRQANDDRLSAEERLSIVANFPTRDDIPKGPDFARAQAAEARLAEAREALTWIANTGQSAMSDHWEYRCEARKRASATLSRLNGEG